MYNNIAKINALREKTIEKAERLKEILADTSEDQQQKKRNINLLIVIEPDGKAQFDDTNNTIWEVRNIPTFENYETFIDLCTRFNFKNVAVVHHGNAFSVHNYKEELLVVLNSIMLKALRNVYEKLENINLLYITNEYIEKFRKKSEEYHNGGLELKDIKSYLSLRLLFNNMLDNSNFFSVACNEADDILFLDELSKMTNKKMKIFANSNFSSLDLDITYTYGTKSVKFGCLLNNYATALDRWNNPDGWYYIDTSNNKVVVTNKDLWLYSTKSKIYDLLERKKELTKNQKEKRIDAQKYYSKKFKDWYIINYGTANYNFWKLSIEKIYPEFKY